VLNGYTYVDYGQGPKTPTIPNVAGAAAVVSADKVEVNSTLLN
jgi:hypothetical protein